MFTDKPSYHSPSCQFGYETALQHVHNHLLRHNTTSGRIWCDCTLASFVWFQLPWPVPLRCRHQRMPNRVTSTKYNIRTGQGCRICMYLFKKGQVHLLKRSENRIELNGSQVDIIELSLALAFFSKCFRARHFRSYTITLLSDIRLAHEFIPKRFRPHVL